MHYEPRWPFDGFNDAGYDEMMPFIVGHETQQTGLIADWIMKNLAPKSVIDIGCGPGNYLTAFPEYVRKLGIDGCATAGSLLGEGQYQRHDLRYPYCAPERFDLAICCEVGEHLERHWMERLIDSVWDCSNTVLLSWATPGQGGTDHLNEQPTQAVLDMFRQRHGYRLGSENAAWREYISAQPTAMEGPDVPEGVVGATGWMRNNSYILYSSEEWREPPWVNEPQDWLGGLTWRECSPPSAATKKPTRLKKNG